MTQEEYLNIASKLESEILVSVEYFEINYEGYQTEFTENSDYDCLDYGINLKMQSGKVFGFIWGSEFTQYGVSILEQPIQAEVSECREVDVSQSSNWCKIVGSQIQNIEVIWHWVKEVGFFKKKTYFPQSVVITFSSGKVVVISALEISDSSHWSMADNIVVFFNQSSAHNYGALNA
ncbi:hypothetical protein [Zooshikella sp. RANM57]|uniref:hypothetical protein n=1 Tax=Zooshikella sp. RANM57 TaxID=3425863 RepID=UPI003D6EBC85